MSNFRWVSDEADRLSIDLSEAPSRIQRTAPKVFLVGINKAKKTLKQMASGHDYLKTFARHVEYDVHSPLEYELGFNKVAQGNLANIAVFGSVNNAPVSGSPADALRIELPHIANHLGDVGADAVLGGDGR